MQHGWIVHSMILIFLSFDHTVPFSQRHPIQFAFPPHLNSAGLPHLLHFLASMRKDADQNIRSEWTVPMRFPHQPTWFLRVDNHMMIRWVKCRIISDLRNGFRVQVCWVSLIGVNDGQWPVLLLLSANVSVRLLASLLQESCSTPATPRIQNGTLKVCK